MNRCVCLLLAACLLLPMGCRRLVPTSAGIMVESYPQTKIKVNSKIFGDHFRVVETAAAKGDNGLLRATVSVENLKGDCQFQYHYRWLDKNGIEVRTGLGVWQPMSAGSREVKLLTGVAPAKNVEDFILDIRFSYGSTRW